jgi:hypothetical protein
MPSATLRPEHSPRGRRQVTTTPARGDIDLELAHNHIHLNTKLQSSPSVEQLASLLVSRPEHKHLTAVEMVRCLNEGMHLWSAKQRTQFLGILHGYLNGQIPSAASLNTLDSGDLNLISDLTRRSQLWTIEALDDVSRHVTGLISRAAQTSAIKPAVVEIAAGYADLSAGLRDRLPDHQIVATDKCVRKQSGRLFDPTVVEARQILKFDARQLRKEDFRRDLSIEDKAPVIVVASHLPLNAGIETVLYKQRNIDHLLLVDSWGYGRETGDPEVHPDRKVWDCQIWKTDETQWHSPFNSVICHSSFSHQLFVRSLTRRESPPNGRNVGAIPRAALPTVYEAMTRLSIPPELFLETIWGVIGVFPGPLPAKVVETALTRPFTIDELAEAKMVAAAGSLISNNTETIAAWERLTQALDRCQPGRT